MFLLPLFYLAFVFLLGDFLRRLLLPPHAELLRLRGERPEQIARELPPLVFNLPAAFLLGVLPSGLVLFGLSSLSRHLGWQIRGSSILTGNLLLLGLVLLLALILRFVAKAPLHRLYPQPFKFAQLNPLRAPKNKARLIAYAIGFVVMGAFTYLLTQVSLYQKGNAFYAISSFVSDCSAHVATISSFARGENLAPVTYPFFSQAGMNYHFFFYFVSANLDALGFSLPAALNTLSALGLFSFASLLGVLSVRFAKSYWAFPLTQLLLFLHSSWSFVPFFTRELASDQLKSLPFWQYLMQNDRFIGKTLHDDWGLWNLNVFANQRHLPLGFAVLLLVLFSLFPLIRQSASGPSYLQKPKAYLRFYWFSKSAWLTPPRLLRPLLAAMLMLAILPYWHGSVLISLLGMLFVLALQWRHKLIPLGLGGLGIGATLVYSRLFSLNGQSSFSPQFVWGFISEDKSLVGVFVYLFHVLGLALPALFLLPFFLKSRERRRLAFSFLIPLLIALTLGLTPDITVNHKYIMFSRFLGIAPLCALLCQLARRPKGLRQTLSEQLATLNHSKRLSRQQVAKQTKALQRKYHALKPVYALRLLAVVSLSILLTLSGFIDSFAYLNKRQHYFELKTQSPFLDFMSTQTKPRDNFLTGWWWYHPFYYSGRQTFYAYSYFSWSAGYNTAERDKDWRTLLKGADGDLERFTELARRYQLDYAILDDGLRESDDFVTDESFFQKHFPKLAEFEDRGHLTVYDLRGLKN